MRRLLLVVLLIMAGAACASVRAVEPAAGPTTTILPLPPVSTTTVTATSTSTSTSTPASTSTPTYPTPADASVAEDARAVVLAGIPGTALDPATAAFLAEGGRGVILFSKNLASREQVRDLTTAMACAAGGEILVAVDQEPGRVARLDEIGITSPAVESGPDQFVTDTMAMGEAMLDIGINFDLAPVLDVARGQNPVLEGRAFGPDPAVVTARGTEFQLALGSLGIVTTAKHFPGHGLSAVDPHRQVTPIVAGLETLKAVDFTPFQAAIDNGIGAVMVGHPIYQALDPSNPASLSPVVLDLLRTDFGFDGVAVTDAFSMVGVREGRTLAEITLGALTAGEDLLIVDHHPEVQAAVAVIEDAVAEGTLSRGRLAEAAARVRRLVSQAAPVECTE